MLLLWWTLAHAGYWLVVDDPQHADVILVLAGESDVRPRYGLQLLRKRYAPRLLLNASPVWRNYNWTDADLAGRYIAELPPNERVASAVCLVGSAQSTPEEARLAAHCIADLRARSVLLVTSEYHTRRARSVFQRVLRGVRVNIAAAPDPANYDVHWWRRRQWAKQFLTEWVRLAWWECLERWRS
jgi:hypothetical protein